MNVKTPVESCCELHPPIRCGPTKCPGCGALGKPVQRITLGALLKPEGRAQIPGQEEFCFCRTPTCDVAYFRPEEVLFQKEDLAVPVWQKERANPDVPVCYCFGWTLKMVRAEVEMIGRSTVIDQIRAQVKAGNCYCEVTNPQGSCCLGNVSSVVKQVLASTSQK